MLLARVWVTDCHLDRERANVHRAQWVGEVASRLEQHDLKLNVILPENVGKLYRKITRGAGHKLSLNVDEKF